MLVSENEAAERERRQDSSWDARHRVRDWLVPEAHDLQRLSREQLEELVQYELLEKVRPGVARVLRELLRRAPR